MHPHAILVAALTMAIVHALIPSHWLAFTMVARSQRWPTSRALTVTAIAGGGHAIVTTILGLVVATIGKTALESLPEGIEHAAASVVLIGLGVFFLAPRLLGRDGGHHDHGPFCTHRHVEDGEPKAHDCDEPHGRVRVISSTTTMATLVSGMTLSPCLDILPLYIAASTLSWPLIVAVSLILAVVTVVLMVVLVWLSLKSLERLKLPWLDRNEPIIAGTVLIALGAYLLLARG